MIRRHRYRLRLCGFYAAIILVCVALSLTGDHKSRFVFLQLPIAPQMALAGALGLLPSLRGLNWWGAYAMFAGPVMAILYALGWLLDRAALEREEPSRRPGG